MKRRTLLHDILGAGRPHDSLPADLRDRRRRAGALRARSARARAEGLQRRAGQRALRIRPPQRARKSKSTAPASRARIAAAARRSGIAGDLDQRSRLDAGARSELRRLPRRDLQHARHAGLAADPGDRRAAEVLGRARFFDALERRCARLGVRIALDDIGIGYSSHRMLIEVRPELFKIDRYFITDCTASRRRAPRSNRSCCWPRASAGVSWPRGSRRWPISTPSQRSASTSCRASISRAQLFR